jgi:hypothetical protein
MLSLCYIGSAQYAKYFQTFTRGSAASRNRTIGSNRVLGKSRTNSSQIERTLVCSLVLNKKHKMYTDMTFARALKLFCKYEQAKKEACAIDFRPKDNLVPFNVQL